MILREKLSQLWAEVLDGPEPNDDDNFVEEGGNSLLATILIARFEEDAGITLGMQEVFQDTFGELVRQMVAA